MPSKHQILDETAIGHECVKCKRIIDVETIAKFKERNRLRNQELIKNALTAQAIHKRRGKRPRTIDYNKLLQLRRRGLTYGQIALKMGINKGSIAYIVRTYFKDA